MAILLGLIPLVAYLLGRLFPFLGSASRLLLLCKEMTGSNNASNTGRRVSWLPDFRATRPTEEDLFLRRFFLFLVGGGTASAPAGVWYQEQN